MKKTFMIKVLLLFCGSSSVFLPVMAQPTVIPIETADYAFVLKTDNEQRLNMVYHGAPLRNQKEYLTVSGEYDLKDGNEAGSYSNAYSAAGTYSLTEPAIQVMHADGNLSLDLKYVSNEIKSIGAGIHLISIVLRDPVYPVTVTLYYKVWVRENVIEQWAEIVHQEKQAISLLKYASANLYLTGHDFYLTTFQGQYAKEMQPAETKLEQGMRSVESKLNTRAMLVQSPDFILGVDRPATENNGEVIMGQLAWSGNFKMEYEVDSYHNLRLIGGINPFAATYKLNPNTIFKTPSFIYTASMEGKGKASRNLHDWARGYRILDGNGERLTLLNNWEATYFSFDENKLTSLFKGAAKLGVDMFLLDDGWFGNKYPRNDDHAGLGDWQENVKKLPHGLGYLVKEAAKENIRFGVWLEPEMVNPKSALYERHPDWVVRQPQRPEIYFRNQLVLDLCNPEVQQFVFNVVDSLFTRNPGLAFIKWDCNSPVFNAYSPWLEKQKLPASHFAVEYVRGLYAVLKRIRDKYPKVPMMLCSGGGGRADYELLKYFTEFWPSDDTEPVERVYQQWDYSYFFPAIATDNHVTDWGKQPIKFRVDVASMGKLGFDIVVDRLKDDELSFCQQAVKNYKDFKEIVWKGDLYRLLNPHENKLASLMYVNKEKSRAIMFSYLVDNRLALTATQLPVRLEGLDPAKTYTIKELNLFPGTRTVLNEDLHYSGDFLMKAGLNPHVNANRASVVLEINEVK
ncbi:MAG: alpha-galactosidase [Bacteroidota bacterium]|nr:alpha-galactosidase [Bacteroidota bacterium]